MGEKTLFDYWMILYERKKGILIIMLSAIITAAMANLFLAETYEAKAVFFIPQKIGANLFLTKEGISPLMQDPLIPTPVEDLQSIYIGFLKSENLLQTVKSRFPEKPPKEWSRDIDFDVTNAFMLTVYVRDKNPKMAADIANAYPLELNKLLLTLSEDPKEKAKQAIKAQIDNLEKKTGKIDSSLIAFEKQNLASSLDQQISLLIEQQNRFAESLSTARVNLKETQKKLEAIEDQMAIEFELYRVSDVIKRDPLIEILEKELSDIEVALAGTKVELQENHPQVRTLQAKYAKTKQNLEKEIERLVSDNVKAPNSFYEQMRHNFVSLLVEERALQSRISGLQEVIEGLKTQVLAFSNLKFKHQEFVNESTRYKEMLGNLYTNFEELKAQILQSKQVVFIVDKAIPPPLPAFPRWTLNIFVAAVTGLIGGIFYALFMEYVDNVRLSKNTKGLIDTSGEGDVTS